MAIAAVVCVSVRAAPPAPVEAPIDVCHESCDQAAGCRGPGPLECNQCKDTYLRDGGGQGLCVAKCSAEKVAHEGACLDNCPSPKLAYGGKCVEECPDDTREADGTCLHTECHASCDPEAGCRAVVAGAGASYAWMPEKTLACPDGTKAVASKEECQAAYDHLKGSADMTKASTTRPLQAGDFQGLPLGCSVSTLKADEFTPHWNTRQETDNARVENGDFRVVCKADAAAKVAKATAQSAAACVNARCSICGTLAPRARASPSAPSRGRLTSRDCASTRARRP